MSEICSFRKVIIYGDLAFVSSDSFTNLERFATQPIACLDLPFTLDVSFTRWLPVRRFATLVRGLIGVSSNEELQDYFHLDYPPRTDYSVVSFFLDSLGLAHYCHTVVEKYFHFNDTFHVFEK